MSESALTTVGNEARRAQLLRAAAEVIRERGFSETRVADVAARAGTSSALVLYYFGSRDQLLVAALRQSEAAFYDSARRLLDEVTSARERLELIVQWACYPRRTDSNPGAWGLRFDLRAQAFRDDTLASARVGLDARWRRMIVDVIRDGRRNGDVGPVNERRFAAAFASLLDGLSIQVLLGDPEINSHLAFRLAMEYAQRELALPARKRPRRPSTISAGRY